jgi:hypothetical protein
VKRKPLTLVEKNTRASISEMLLSMFQDVPGLMGYKDRRVLVSDSLAGRLLLLNYMGQRTLRIDQAKTLHRAMVAKNAYAPNNVIAFSYNPDNPDDLSMVCLLNGQHTLTAMVSSGTSWPLIISLFPCRSRADIEFHYSVFDQARARTQLDVSRAVGLADTIRQHKLPKQAISALGSATGLIRAHFKELREIGRDKLSTARLSRDWVKEASVIYGMIETPDRRSNPDAPVIGNYGKFLRKRLTSPSFFGVLLVAMRSHPTETVIALKDLISVADQVDNDETPSDHGIHDVADFLSTTSISAGSDRRIATRNFIHLLVALRHRQDGEDFDVQSIIIDGMPSVREADALWDILTEDRLSRSIVAV